jgi:hypothetical protein
MMTLEQNIRATCSRSERYKCLISPDRGRAPILSFNIFITDHRSSAANSLLRRLVARRSARIA